MAAISPVNHQRAPAHQDAARREFGSLSNEVLRLLREAIREAGKAPGKDIVALIGNTGTGKSTAVNDFTGHRIVYVPRIIGGVEERVMRVAEGVGIAPIGHEGSETLYTHIYPENPIPGTSLVLADSGGFLDTRGKEKEIAVLTSLKLTLENSRSARIVLCCEGKTIAAERGIHFVQFAQTALKDLMQDYQRFSRSIFLMVTKPPRFEDDYGEPPISYTERSVVKILQKIKIGFPRDSGAMGVLDYLLRDDGRYIGVYRPTAEETKERILERIREMAGIEDPRGFFKIPYSPGVKLKLIEVMTEISVNGTRLYQNFFNNLEMIERLNREKGKLIDKVDRIREALQIIGDGLQDPVEVQRHIEIIIEQQEAIILEQREEILRCERGEQEIVAEQQSIRERLNCLDRDGNEKEEYWTLSYQEPGIILQGKEVRETHHSSEGIFKSSSETTTETRSFEKRFPRSKEFNYRGPEIADFELSPPEDAKNPESNPYWSELQPQDPRGSDAFSARYVTAEGEDADAKVKIFVEKKNTPMLMIQKLNCSQDLGMQSERLHLLVGEKRNHERIIERAERTKDQQGSVSEKIAQYQANLEELELEIQRIDEEFAALVLENERIKEEIQAYDENFMFLKNYLDLSQDRELASGKIIRRFIELNRQFEALPER